MRRFFDYDFDGLKLTLKTETFSPEIATFVLRDVFAPPLIDIPLFAEIDGTSGDDTLDGTADADTINGFGGNDIINGLGGDDILRGGDGDDVLIGGDGHDILDGGAGNDTFIGGQFNDIIIGGAGADILMGDIGIDTVDYSASSSRVIIDYENGGTGADAEGDTYSSIETFELTSFNDEISGFTGSRAIVFGGDGDDIIDISGADRDSIANGGPGNDIIYGGTSQSRNGGDGDDILFSSRGINTFNGGDGFDTIDFSNAFEPLAGVRSDLQSNRTGLSSRDTYISIEAINGTIGNDELSGNSSDNLLMGRAGDDILNGRTGNDTLIGGNGNDIAVYGRLARLHTLVDNQDGTFSITANFGFDGTDLLDGIEVLSFSDQMIAVQFFNPGAFTENDDIVDGSFIGDTVDALGGDDTVNGLGGDDVISGGAGEDFLNGGDGNDSLDGGTGNDHLDGGEGEDFAVYNGNVSDYHIINNGDGTFTVTDNVNGNGLDTLTNIEDVQIGTEFVDLSTILAASFELSSLLAANGGDGSAGFVINGIDFNDQSGRSVSSAGDVNGDGFDDILIGAFRASPNGNYNSGESYVIFGNSESPAISLDLATLLAVNGGDGTVGFVINGIDGGDYSGRSVSSAGDINGDGFEDILIGAFGADPNGSFSGESYVVFGSDAGFGASLDLSSLNGTNGFVINGIGLFDNSGDNVSSAGDINGDGFDDILIGASNADPNGAESGETYVVFGRDLAFAASFELSGLLAVNGGDGTSGFVINGIDGDDGSGYSVSSAGDINGDGFGDIIIGATYADPNGAESGESYIVFGSGAGFGASLELSSLNGTNGFVIGGIDEFDESGMSVSSAGDINGDGFDDVIIGAERAGLTGESYVVLGGDIPFTASLDLSSLDGTNGFVINGIDESDRSGSSVSSAGDINGDGFDDILIGARRADPNGDLSGESYVVFGNDAGFGASLDVSSLDGTTGFVINGIGQGDLSGGSVSAAGDINGDGFDDILIGAASADPNGNGSAGESYVIYGQADFGRKSEILSDNNDTYTASDIGEVIFGLAGDDVINGGTASDVIFGDEGVDILSGNSGNDRLEGGAGNDTLDGGDGQDVAVYNGNLTDYVIVNLGNGTFTVTDNVNGNGVDRLTNIEELQVGTEHVDLSTILPGPVFELSTLLSANGGDGMAGFVINGIDSGDGSGGSVSSAGDVNGDGFDDVLIGAVGASPNGNNSGETYVVFGSALGFGPSFDLSDLNGNNGFVLNGVRASDFSGITVSLAEDFNGDGFGDVLMTALDGGPNGFRSGQSYLVFGSSEPFNANLELALLDGTDGFAINGIDSGDASGRSISSAGDVNGDGFSDILIGAYNGDPSGSSSGESYVIFGSNALFPASLELSTLDGNNGFVINGINSFDDSGSSVSSAGDINGDGFGDILIGASDADPNGTSSGESYVIFGSDVGFGASLDLSTLNGSNGFVINGVDAFDNSGASVSSGGDINGDGYDDIIIGARAADPNGTSTGESYVIFGQADSFGASFELSDLFASNGGDGTKGFIINGVNVGDASGDVVSSAGDINGDGFDDILIGANGADPNGSNSGASYLIFGSDTPFAASVELSALNGTNGFVINGIDINDYSAASVSSAGDINGDGFDDLLIGAGGADSNGMYGNGESYVIYGSADFGRTVEILSVSDDIYTVSDTGEVVYGLAGNDVINGGAASDVLSGDEGDDTLSGNAGNDRLEGGVGNDALDGGSGNDIAVYNGNLSDYDIINNGDGTYAVTDNINGNGVDTLTNMENVQIGTNHVDLSTILVAINGTPGNDNLTGTAIDEAINGFAGNDILTGLAGNDEINGGDGADRLIGGEGADVLNGGAGFDSADYRGAASGVRFNVDTGGTLGDAQGDIFSGIERYFLSNFNDIVTGSSANEFFYGEDGNDQINGGGGIDRIYGGDGNDVQRGDAGNDTLYGSDGADQLNGGAGTDIANYSNASTAVTVNLASGGTVGDANGDTYFGIEAVYGSDFNDSLTGNTSGNELRGEDGDDTLDGGVGNDRLFGGAGADTLIGGSGVDSVYYTDAAAAVTVDLTTGGIAGDANGDTYSSIEWVFGSDFGDTITADGGNNRIYGEDGDDVIFGEGGNDRLLGGEGNDTIAGGSGVDVIFGQNGDDTLTGNDGNDFFYGGAGADSFDGGADFDTVNYLPAAAGVTVNMLTGGTGGEAAGDTFTSIERVLGTGFDDTIVGNGDNNTLLGNGGDDFLQGGGGNDSLFGGAGADTFGYDVTSGDADVINQFTTNEEIWIFGNDTSLDTWTELQAFGSDSGSNVIFNFGGGNTLTIIGQNLADLDASNFSFFGGTAAEPLSDPDAFAADVVDAFDMDALI